MNPLSFLADVGLRSSLVLAFVLVLQLVLKRASAAEKHFILVLGLIVVAVIPAGLLLSPRLPWTIKLPISETSILMLPEQPVDSPELSHPALRAPPHALPESARPLPNHQSRRRGIINHQSPLLLLFSLGAFAQLIILAKGAWSWRGIRRSAAHPPSTISSLDPIQTFASARRTPPILVSDEITVPVLVGWLRPVIILPRDTLEDSASSSLPMILCHEIAHFRRGDTFLLPLHWLLQILYWWHPLVWLSLARLRHEREIACDDFVLSQNFRATDYAGLIVNTARDMQSVPRLPPGVLAMAAGSAVGQRVTSILNPRVRRKQAGGWVTWSGNLTALCLSWPMVATQIKPADQHLAAFTIAPSNPSPPQIQVSFRLVFIDQDSYLKNQPEMDAALAAADPSVIGKLPGAYVLSTPSYITEPGKKLDFADVKPMSFATDFNSDDYGNIVPTAFRTQNLGPTFENTASLEPDNESITLQFKCSLTYFRQWRLLPSGGRRPLFGKKVLWAKSTIHNGHALWIIPGSSRYLPPDDLSTHPFAANWPDGKDTGPKRMFILVSTRAVKPSDLVDLVSNSPLRDTHP